MKANNVQHIMPLTACAAIRRKLISTMNDAHLIIAFDWMTECAQNSKQSLLYFYSVYGKFCFAKNHDFRVYHSETTPVTFSNTVMG